MRQANLSQRAERSLCRALQQFRPQAVCDNKGYVADLADNLLSNVPGSGFEEDFGQGAGRELDGKMRAAHSSSALAVNVFAGWRLDPSSLSLVGQRGFEKLRFEARCPIGLDPPRTPPHLDLLLTGTQQVVAVESKCLEPLTRKRAKFADAYVEQITDGRRASGWYSEMQELRQNPTKYLALDAAQLIKHAFGLARCFADRPVLLLYLFWEPLNAVEFPEFARHRDEFGLFSKRVSAGSTVSLRSLSYPELFLEWQRAALPAWLSAHLRELHARYSIRIERDGAT